MAKKKKLRMRKETLILFGILGLGLLIVLMGYDFSLTSPEYEVRTNLEGKGYEVVKVWDLGSMVDVDMKSSGTRLDQAWNGMLALSYAYPDAEQYNVWIIEETKSCRYTTSLTNYKSYQKSVLNQEAVHVDNRGYLDGINFTREVMLAQQNLNAEYGFYSDSFWNRYRESYPEVNPVILRVVKYNQVNNQVMSATSCE